MAADLNGAREQINRAIAQRDRMADALLRLLYMCGSDVRVIPMLRGFSRRLNDLERSLLNASAALREGTTDGR